MQLPSYITGKIVANANRVLRMQVVSCLEAFDLTPTAWSFLGEIISHPDGIRLVTVAKHLHVKAPLITMMSNNFIDRGYIERIAHHTDGRAKLLVMTAVGKRFVQKVETEMNHQLEKLLIGASEQDLSGYKTVLETIIANGRHA